MVTEEGGTTGWLALQTADELLAGLAVGTAAVPDPRARAVAPGPGAGARSWSALATLGVVLVKLLDGPGTSGMSEPRQGLLIALGCAGVLVASSVTLAQAPRPAARRVRTYTPLPAPVYEPDAS